MNCARHQQHLNRPIGATSFPILHEAMTRNINYEVILQPVQLVENLPDASVAF